jgi:hypothetical protein
MIKLEYGLCVIMLSKCICDPWHNMSTVNTNCLVKQTNAYTEIYFIPRLRTAEHAAAPFAM